VGRAAIRGLRRPGVPEGMRLRVALIVERFEPDAGGLEDAAWQTARALRDAGDAVTVLARRARPCSGITCVELPVQASWWQPTRVLGFAAQAGRWLAKARRDDRIDLAHAWNRVPGADLFHGGEGSHAHYLVRTHGKRGARWRRGSPRHAAILALERRIFAAGNVHLQSVSPQVERELCERFPLPASRVHRVAYGVDLERFQPGDATKHADFRAQLDPTSGQVPRFLFAGSGWRRKGLDTALRALAAMEHRDARLWIAGGDAPAPWQRRALQLGVEPRVQFLGRRSDLERIYPAADALLFPTRYDAFGLVALEAAACATPCVLSATAGAAELLAPGACVVDDPEDVAGFAAALDRLCDPAARAPLAEAAHAIASEHSWEQQTARLREVYRKRLAR